MDNRRKTAILVAILVVISGSLFMYRLNVRGLAEPDEGRYAEIAREMVESGDWIYPRLNYILHMHKPPMSYWLIAGSFSVFGVNEFAARFPSAIAAILTAIATFFIGKRLAGLAAGFIAGIVLISMPQFIGSARLAFPDMFLTCFVTLGFACFIRGCSSDKKRAPFLLFWLFAGLGMMTKGPVALLIMLVPVLVYILVMREWGLVRQMQPFNGIILFLIVSLPWYLYVITQLEGLFGYFVGEQTAERLTSDFREVPRYFLVGVLGMLTFPWLFYLLAGIGTMIRDGTETDHVGKRKFLVLIWFSVVIVFFSLMRSSIASYILPAYPPAAIITGMFLARAFSSDKKHVLLSVATALTMVVMFVLALALIRYPLHESWDTAYSFLRGTIIAYAVILLAAVLVLLVLSILRKTEYVVGVLALLSTVFFVLFLHRIPDIEKRMHWRVKGKHFAEEVLRLEREGDDVVMMKQYYADLPFYLKRRVLHLHVHREKRFEDPAVYQKLVMFGYDAEERLLQSEVRTFFVAPKAEYERVSFRYPDNSHFIMEVKGHVLFCNLPLD